MEDDNKNNLFAIWLFNQYVENHRKYGKEARVYWWILETYVEIGFPDESQKRQKEYAHKLLTIIDGAFPDFNTHLLILRGEEGIQDYKEQMESYIYRLNRLGHTEQEIIELIIKRLKLNYGNEN